MSLKEIKENIDGVDIYILDQILKIRYFKNEKILDAGCGSGRNLKWFYNSGYAIYGVDISHVDIAYCKTRYSKQKENFKVASLEHIPFEEHFFEHVICNAVLHFSKDVHQFKQLFSELKRVLKPKGSLFIRIASEFGNESNIVQLKNGRYKLADGSERFLLTAELLQELKNDSDMNLVEDVKTTIVENKRSMTTLVFEKV